jgi:hypothetical integral membrane protein (TIGR02206 family)
VAHLVTLVGLAIGIAVLVRAYGRTGTARRLVMRRVVGISAFGLEVFREVAYAVQGFYEPALMPLHLCAVATICAGIDAVKANSWSREYLYALGLWGPACALLFPDWAGQPWFNLYTWQAFVIHALLIAYILMILVSGEFRPDPRRLWKAVVIMVAAIAASVWANHVWGTNFWFLNVGSPGSPLEPIQQLTGPWYIPVLVALLAIIWTVMYLPWRRRVSRS